MISQANRAAAKKGAALLRMVASPTRVLILQVLETRRGAYVREIADHLDMTQSAISHQLALLARTKIIGYEQDGRTVKYFLTSNPATKRLIRALKQITS
jgi:ArsR family transcriptional regulator, lead/cadmium/zinc/bismuth-responsive transcriptional repressor